MPSKADHLRTLARICRQFGGRLSIITQQRFYDLFTSPVSDSDGLNEAPFVDAHGVHWRNKIIYVVQGHERVGALIHEMGHVFAAPHPPDHRCSECHEWDWLGWEITLARQIGAARVWTRHNMNYQTEERAWGELTRKKRRHVISERLSRAREVGYIGADGSLRSLR